MLCIVFVVFAIYAILYIKGRLVYRYNIVELINQEYVWISIGLTLLISTFTVILIITTQEKAYEKLLKQSIKSEADYRLLFEQSTEGIVISDINGKILLVNQNFNLLSGFSKEEIIGRNFKEFLIPEDLELNPIQFDMLIKGETVTSERRAIDKLGNIRFLEIRASILPDGRLQSMLRDISESKRIQREIENEKAFGKNLIEAMHGVFYVFENYENLVQWNDSLLKISGYYQDELE